MSSFENNIDNQKNSSEKEINNLENITSDPSRAIEKKEKREYLQHNKTQFKFFSEETKRLREEIKNTEGSSEIESLRKELDYAVFRRSQESLFEDYLSDDFDEEMFNDELEDVRKNELKYLKRQNSGSENESDISMSNFYNMITEEVTGFEGINENDSKFREKINPFIDQLVAKKDGPSNWTHLELEDKIIGAKKYNKDNYLNKFKKDLELSKNISKVTKENEEFMSIFDGHISGGGQNIGSEAWNEFHEKFGDTFLDDLSNLDEKGTSQLPWIALAEDQFSGETAKGWLDSESSLFTDLTADTKNDNFDDVAIFKKRLQDFNKKYNFDTLSRAKGGTVVSAFSSNDQRQEKVSNSSDFSSEEKEAVKNWDTVSIPVTEKKSEYKGLTREEIEESKKFLETINVSGSKEKKDNLEIPIFNDYDERAEFYRENIEKLAESKFEYFKETINPTIENNMKDYILESIRFEIDSKNKNENMKGKTFSGNINSLGIGIGSYIQRLIALKSGKVLDIVDIQKLSIRQVARDYLNVTELPKGFNETYSDRIPDREI